MNRNQQAVNVQPMPPAKRPSGAVINGYEGYYPDADERRIVTVNQPAPRVGGQLQRMPQPEQAPLLAGMTPTATTIVQQRDDEVTRAKATVIVTTPLSIALAVVVTAAVLTLSGTPVLSAVTLITFFTVFALTWGGALAYLVARSPSGIAHMHTNRMWRVIEREQAHRHEVAWHMIEREEEGYE